MNTIGGKLIMRIFKQPGKEKIRIPLNCVDLYLLGIKSKARKELKQAELECNLEKYKDILVCEIVRNSRGEWWRT